MRPLAPLACLLVFATSTHADSPIPRTVSDDGRSEVLGAEGPSQLLFGSGSVPLPAVADWTSDLERAVGGMAFADVDADGDLDLVLGCYFQSGFPPVNDYENLVHFNVGGVLETTPSWVAAVERHTTDCRIGDINGDGIADVFFANNASVPSAVYYGASGGGPSTTADWLSGGGSTFSTGAALGDLTGDGLIDLVQTNQGTGQFDPIRPLQVFVNQGAALEIVPSYQSADSMISNAASIADIDRSHEVTVTSHTIAADGVKQIFLLPHQPIAAFDRIEVIGALGAIPYTTDREIGRVHFASPPAAGTTIEIDYKHSPLPDVAVSRWVNYATCVYGNTGSGLSSVPTWDNGDPAETDRGVGFSDVDADGDLDLALSGSRPTVLYENDGSALADTIWTADSTYFGSQEMAWGDVDGDGDEDLATIEFGNGHLRVYLNQGGVLERVPGWFYDFSSSGSSLAWGDVNGDGRLDLVAGTAREEPKLFLNTGGAVNAPEVAPSVGYRTAIAAYPNPFEAETDLRFDGPRVAEGTAIRIINLAGQTVRELQAGAAGATWDGRDAAGNRVPAGVYFLRSEVQGEILTGRVVRVR